jgi:hypothetical protein
MVRSMQGKEIDMDKLMRQNELMPAVGNVKVNARGDELGPGGKIVRKREDVLAEYYEDNPKAKPDAPEPLKTKTEVEEQPTSRRTK